MLSFYFKYYKNIKIVITGAFNGIFQWEIEKDRNFCLANWGMF